MKNLIGVLVLLAVAGVGRAGEKEIIEGLKRAGAFVANYSGERGNTLLAVRFQGDEFTDANLTDLCELQSLGRLVLSGKGFTDAGLRTVGGLKGLTYLSFVDTKVTDAGLKEVAGLEALQILYLGRCPGVTDASVDSLARMKGLKRLYLKGTDVTKEGVARIKKALPDCDIVFDKP
jgi:internalin A